MPRPPLPETLDTLLTDCWDQLTAAAETGKHGFHLPVLGTLAAEPETNVPELRTVVLRAADADRYTVLAHTDTRSPKAKQIRQHREAAWLFYDRDCKLQVRLAGPTDLLTFHPPTSEVDVELVRSRWDASTLSSRRCYLAPAAPGTPADQPSPNLPAAFRNTVPQQEAQVAPGEDHFAVIRTRAATLDALLLHHAGHRRARYAFDQAGRVITQTWLEV
jgi:hypothetical protein